MTGLEKQGRWALIVLATICVTYFVENFLRSAASALSPVLIQELGINKASMGLLISGYFLIYGIMQFPSGILASVLGPRKAILGFTVLTVIGSVLFWLSYSFELLLAAQFIMGVGCSVFYINAVTIVGRWFPPDRKATAIGVLSASSGIGMFTSYMGFPLAISVLGNWRGLFLGMLIVLALNWAANFWLLKDGPEVQHPTPKARTNIIQSFRETIGDKRLHPFLVCYILLSFNFLFFNFLPQFMTEGKGFTYVEAGIISSTGTVAGFLGCLSMGWISDRLHRRKAPILFFLGTYLALLAIMILIPGGYPVAVYAGLVGGMNFCLSLWVLFFSMVGEVMPPEKASIGLGLMNGANTISFSLMAPVYGMIIDSTGSYVFSNMIILAAGIVNLFLLYRFTKETYGGGKKP